MAVARERGRACRRNCPSRPQAGNVLLAAPESGGSHPIPKVTDFGLAKLSDTNDHLTITGTAVGTPHYMPPPEPRAGSWSIGGCLCDRCDALRMPHGPTAVRRGRSGGVDRTGRPSDADSSCEDFSRPCRVTWRRSAWRLEKSPGDRYQSATALADDLDRVLGGRPTLARPVSWSGHLLRWCRRNPVPATLAAGLIGAILLGAGVT